MSNNNIEAEIVQKTIDAELSHNVIQAEIGNVQVVSGSDTPALRNHISDHSIHFTVSEIHHSDIQGIGVNTHAQIDTHIADSDIHFDKSDVAYSDLGGNPSDRITAGTNLSWDGDTLNSTGGGYPQSDIDHVNIQSIGVNTHAQIDTHIADSDIHFVQSDIDHVNLQNIGVNTHPQIDSHIDDTDIHFTEVSIDHTSISNIGSNTHAQIDTHIADSDIHFDKSDVAYSDLDGNPSDRITAGTNLSWDGDTLNAAGGGDVSGPVSSTDNALARWDGTAGDTLQDGTVIQDDNGGLSAVDGISLNTSPSGTYTSAGDISWNSTSKTMDIPTGLGPVLQVGQESFLPYELGCNETGSQIDNGEAVYLTNDGSKITISLANSRDPDIIGKVVGVATQDIADGACGLVTTYGLLRGYDTTGLSFGTVLYLSPDTDGALTSTEPSNGDFIIPMAIVTTPNDADGELFVRYLDIRDPKDIKAATGFPSQNASPSATSYSFNDGTRTFSISPTGDFFYVWELGVKYLFTTTQTVTIPSSSAEGLFWFYFDGGTLSYVQNPTVAQSETLIRTKPLVAQLYFDEEADEAILIGNERHGHIMSSDTHAYLHYTRGAQYISGLALGDIEADEDGDSDAYAQFSVAAGVTADEDIIHISTGTASTAGLPIFWLKGANKYLRRETETGFSVLTDTTAGVDTTGRLVYNDISDGSLQVVTSNNFVLCHVFATNSPDDPVIAFVGQNEYGTRGLARAGAETEISTILTAYPNEELVAVATVIFKTSTGFSNSVKATIISNDEGDDYTDWTKSELKPGASPSAHPNLATLGWTDSGHTGTANEFAGFDGAGGATTYGQDDIDHTSISNVGSNTHAQIDTHIADTDIHFEKGDVAYSDLAGNPSDRITAGTNLSWDGDTLNASGAGGTTDHSELSNLAWSDSGHTGTVSTLPAFGASGTAIEGPRSLTTDTTFYVRTSGATTPGNDSNTGLSNDAAGAWLTIQHALDEAERTISNGYTMTIQVADDNITEACTFEGMLDGGSVELVGNTTTPANVTWGASSDESLVVKNPKALLDIDGFTLGGGTTTRAILVNSGATLTMASENAIVFDACSLEHINIQAGSTVRIQGNYSIIDGANRHWNLLLSGTLVCVTRTITLTDTPSFSEFLLMQRQSRCQIGGNTFSGSATGSRFDITGGSVADAGDEGLTYLPGNTAGTLADGGNYDGIVAFDEIQLPDDGEVLLGTAGDASLTYNGTDLVCNPQEVGSGGYICYYNKSLHFKSEYDNGSKTANFTVDWDSNGQKQKATLTANTITLTLDNPANGVGNFTLKLVNGGLATLTWAATSGSVYWPGGSDPDLTSSGTDIVTFYYDGTNFYGVASLDFS